MKKTHKQFVPVAAVLAGRHKLDDAKLETLNRARLDALGGVLQAQHFTDKAVETAHAAVEALKLADAKLRERKRTWKRADRAFFAYLEKGGAK